MILKNKYSQRLLGEWIKHGKIIIASDFDSTISPFRGEVPLDNEEDIARCIDLLKACQQTGCYLIIHTACKEDRHQSIKDYCAKVGLKVDTINQNPVPLTYGNNGKPFANIFLDDRAGLNEAMDILESALYQYRGTLEKYKYQH